MGLGKYCDINCVKKILSKNQGGLLPRIPRPSAPPPPQKLEVKRAPLGRRVDYYG